MSLPMAELAAREILNSIPQGMVLAAIAWMLLRVFGRQSSATRFAIWMAVFAAVATLPFIGSADALGEHGPAASEPVTPAISIPSSWAAYLLGLWACIALLGLVRVALGMWRLRRLRQACTPLPASSLPAELQMALSAVQDKRGVELYTSDEVRVPTAMGFFRPGVVIPAWALRELSESELKVVLLHEFAHLRRWDDWTNLLQKLAGALFFFQPALWWIDRKLTVEREMACDDLVLSQTANPRAYAQCLVRLAEKSMMRRGLALANAAVGRVHQTAMRLAQILDVNRPTQTRAWKPVITLCIVFSAAALVSFSDRSNLVSFTGPEAGAPLSAQELLPASPAPPPVPLGMHREQSPAVVPAKLKIGEPRRAKGLPTLQAAGNNSGIGAMPAGMAKEPSRAALAPAAAHEGAFSPQNVVFVVETQQLDSSGAVSWSVSIVRWTVYHPAYFPQRAVPAKSI